MPVLLRRYHCLPPRLDTERKASGRPFHRDRFSVYALRVTLSVVLITYNEESNLPRTLESVMPLVRDEQGEIVVVDSCSTDRSREIAERAGAKLLKFDWQGGFPKKRNWVLMTYRFSTKWVLFLDADE